MEKNIALYPLSKGLFSAAAVMPKSYRVTDLIEEFWLRHGCLPALFDISVRFPGFQLNRCIHYNLFFYTPEKPGCQSAFMVHTHNQPHVTDIADFT